MFAENQKLTIDQQIEDMESKDIRFAEESDPEHCLLTKDNAKRFLKYNSYYYRLKHYADAFEVRRNASTKKYINVTFGKVVELSKLDMYLRKVIMHMCLDVEHVLKTRLMNDITINPKEDGKCIVGLYLDDYTRYQAILCRKSGNSIVADLIERFPDSAEELPAWKFVEVLTFGEFIDFYTFYYDQYPEQQRNSYVYYLGNIRFLRNAAAHNACMLAKLRSKRKFDKTVKVMNALSKIHVITGSKEYDYKRRMENHVVHDFVTLLCVYHDLLDTGANRSMLSREIDEIKGLFDPKTGRMCRHKELFAGDNVIEKDYRFVWDLICYIDNRQHGKHKKIL